MEIIKSLIDPIIHLDKYLGQIIQSLGIWTYLLLFMIIFAETGLVVTPFLPGDSLLFACGAFSAKGSFDVAWLFVVLSIAAVIGDSVNYAIGKFLGPKVFHYENSKIFKKEYLNKTHNFYEKYGAKTIILARFVPIVRTFAPFVAGIGKMSYPKFFAYNVIGGILWVAVFIFSGYFFGNIPAVQHNFTFVIFVIIVISVLPVVYEVWRHKKGRS